MLVVWMIISLDWREKSGLKEQKENKASSPLTTTNGATLTKAASAAAQRPTTDKSCNYGGLNAQRV